MCVAIAMIALLFAFNAQAQVDKLQERVSAMQTASELGSGCDMHGVPLTAFQIADRRLTAVEALLNSLSRERLDGVIARRATEDDLVIRAANGPVMREVSAKSSLPASPTPGSPEWYGKAPEVPDAPRPACGPWRNASNNWLGTKEWQAWRASEAKYGRTVD